MPVDLKRVSRDTFYLAILTTVTIMAWIGFAILRSLTAETVTPALKQQLEPLPAGLNQKALGDLRQRIQLQEGQFTLPEPVTESGKSVSIESSEATPVATVSGGL